MNTTFTYMYRDASNYKTSTSVVFKGVESDDLIKSAFDKCGEAFIPSQVGLSSLSIGSASGLPTTDDCVFCEFSKYDFVKTSDDPSVDQDINDFLKKLISTEWDIEKAVDELYCNGIQIYGNNNSNEPYYAILTRCQYDDYSRNETLPDDIEWLKF